MAKKNTVMLKAARDLAIAKAGGVVAVAEGCGVHKSAVSRWKKIPDDHVPTVARLAKMAPQEIRPDLAAMFKEGRAA